MKIMESAVKLLEPIIRIENWCTRPNLSSPFQAPEQATGLHLAGNVYDHSGFRDGEFVGSSEIVAVDGRLVTTRSGRVYRLGQPDRKWLAWLRKEGLRYNPDEPIRDTRKAKGGPS